MNPHVHPLFIVSNLPLHCGTKTPILRAMKTWISRLVFLLLLGCCLVWLIPALLVHVLAYDQLLHYVVGTLHRPDLENTLRTRFFTASKFSLLQTLLPVLALVGTSVAAYLWYKRKNILHTISGYLQWCAVQKQKIALTWRETAAPIRWLMRLLLLLLAARSVYYATTWNVQYDEAWNYNYFLGQKWWYSIVAYNNYPLHNLLAWPLAKLMPGATTLAMRIPGILAGLTACFGVFVCTQRLWRNERLSLLCSALFACLPVTVFYMLYARGVMLEILFALPLAYFIIKAMQQPMSRNALFTFVVLQALGTYSMLSHPYFIAFSGLALVVSQLFKHKSKWFAYSWLLIASVLAGLLLLVPVMMGTGLGLGLQVAAGQHSNITLSLLLTQVEKNAQFITGYSYAFYVLALINLIALRHSSKQVQATALLNFCLLLCPIFIPLLTHTVPPERALAFLVVVPVLTMGLAIRMLPKPIPAYAYGLGGLLLISILSWKSHTHGFLNWSRKKDKAARETATVLMQQGVQTLYNQCADMSYYIPAIDYYYRIEGQHISFYSSEQASTRYAPVSESGKFDITASCCPDTTVTPPRLVKRFYGVCLTRNH